MDFVVQLRKHGKSRIALRCFLSWKIKIGRNDNLISLKLSMSSTRIPTICKEGTGRPLNNFPLSSEKKKKTEEKWKGEALSLCIRRYYVHGRTLNTNVATNGARGPYIRVHVVNVYSVPYAIPQTNKTTRITTQSVMHTDRYYVETRIISVVLVCV